MLNIVRLGFLVLGIVQLFAVIDGLEYWLSVPALVAFFLALPVVYNSFIGAGVGMYAAVAVWHWSWLQAAALFVGPTVLVFMIVAGLSAAAREV